MFKYIFFIAGLRKQVKSGYLLRYRREYISFVHNHSWAIQHKTPDFLFTVNKRSEIKITM